MLWSCSTQRFKACGHKKKGRVAIFCFVLMMALLPVLIWRSYYVIQPSIDAIAEIKAKEMVSYAINEATCKQFFKESTNIEDLLIINSNNQGNIELVQSNTVAMNILAAELSKEIKQMYAEMKPTEVSVPLGTILGSQILSQSNFKINLKVSPISVSSLEFLSEFETQGINQTKYKVYLTLKSKVRVMAPFSSKTMEIKNVVLVAEAVILGQVPNSYVVVPEKGILDASDF